MHDPQRTLVSLKELRHKRGDSSPFGDHPEFLSWADAVAPLLAFDSSLAKEFSDSVKAATGVRTWRPDKYVPAINNAIGAVNQAITLLEHIAVPSIVAATSSSGHPSPTEYSTPSPEVPERLTLKWLYEHAPWSFYVWLLGALSVAFSLGFAVSEVRIAMYSASLSKAEPTTIQPTRANALTTQASQPSINIPHPSNAQPIIAPDLSPSAPVR